MTAVFIFLSIPALLVGVDLCAAFYRWQARIHIGRWSDRLRWQRALERKARQWLRREPAVRVSDSQRWVLYDMVRGKYRSRTVQSWQKAGLLMGLSERESAQAAARLFDAASGGWRRKPEHLDAALLAHVLKKNGALPPAAEKTVVELLLSLKKGRKTIPYRAAIPHVRFVDTIGLAMPFLTGCGFEDIAAAQIEEYDRALMPRSRIPAHAYDLTLNAPLGIYDWSRGVGWYILGLIESNLRGGFDDRIVALATEMLRYQRPGGGFGAMLFNSSSPVESSGTALAGLLMLEAYRIGLDRLFLDAAFAAERALISSTRRNGALDYCQGDTLGTGSYSRIFSVMPFAQGIALRLSKELNGYANR